MTKYSKHKLEQCKRWVSRHGLMEYGGATLTSFCREADIDEKTYYRWLTNNEFRQAIQDAQRAFKSHLVQELSITLAETAKGYDKELSETLFISSIDGTPQAHQMRKFKKHYPPNVAAAIFLLTNLDPEHYKNRQNTDVVIKKDDEQQMTIEEIDKEIARIEKLEKGAGQSKDGSGNQQ